MPENTMAPEVAEFYARGGETHRLETAGQGRLEFLRTQDILRRLLPSQQLQILDVGGATGVHAAWLAQDGHTVTVVDPLLAHVTAASAIPGVTAEVGDARQLPYDDDTFDAVVLLGPLYHLQTRAERLHALGEAHRVARTGALIAAAAIGRFTPWLDNLIKGLLDADYSDSLLREALDTGQLRPRHHGSDNFTTAYVHHPAQLGEEFAAAGLHDVELYAVEGPAWMDPNLGDQLNSPIIAERILAGLRRLEKEPSLLGASAHLIAAATAEPTSSS